MNLRNLRERMTGTPEADTSADFGLGGKVARSPGTRLINNDGSLDLMIILFLVIPI